MFQLITFVVRESYKELLLRNALRSLVYILFVSFLFRRCDSSIENS